MKLTPGQKQFTSGVAEALTRAFAERLMLRVEVAADGGTAVAHLLDGTGRSVWSQTAEGAQLDLFAPRAAPAAPASPGAPNDATPPTDPSSLVCVECPADPSLHPQDWAEALDVSYFTEGLVRWEMTRDRSDDDAPARAWTFVPRAVADRIVERLATSATPVTVGDADAKGEVMLLSEGGKVNVIGNAGKPVAVHEAWTATNIKRGRTTLTSPGGEVSGEVDTDDVRWVAGGFCCIGTSPRAMAERKVSAPKKAAPKKKAAAKKEEPIGTPTRLWIAEADWDALSPEERTELESYGTEWQGTEGYVYADVPGGKVLLALRGIAQELGVKVLDYTPTSALVPKKPAKPAKGKGQHRHEAVPEADELAERGVCTLVRQGPERWEVNAR